MARRRKEERRASSTSRGMVRRLGRCSSRVRHRIIPDRERGPERCNASGSAGTSAVTLSHGRNGLSARRMAVWWTFREPSLCRHVHREFMRNAVLDLTPIIPATACHQRNYVETYSRCNQRIIKQTIQKAVVQVKLHLSSIDEKGILTRGLQGRSTG